MVTDRGLDIANDKMKSRNGIVIGTYLSFVRSFVWEVRGKEGGGKCGEVTVGNFYACFAVTTYVTVLPIETCVSGCVMLRVSSSRRFAIRQPLPNDVCVKSETILLCMIRQFVRCGIFYFCREEGLMGRRYRHLVQDRRGPG